MANEKRLIEANALLEKIQFRLPVDDHISECIDECVKMARKIINDAPTVAAVEVVHGRWKIEWEYERDSITGECDESPVATCPFCGHKEWGFAYDDYWGKPYNYCPNCGAKMDGDGNGTTQD